MSFRLRNKESDQIWDDDTLNRNLIFYIQNIYSMYYYTEIEMHSVNIQNNIWKQEDTALFD